MKLYDFALAPSPRRVRMYLAEKGIEVPTQQVNLREGEHLADAYLKINPRATVPVLELDDGTVICEFPAICRYFEEQQPEPPLMGTDAKDKAVVIMWDRFMEYDGFMAVAEALRNSAPRLENRALTGPVNVPQIPELAERGRERVQRFMKNLDTRLGEHEFVAGARFTVADITAFVAIEFAGVIKMEVPDDHANLKRWHASVAARPSAKA